MSAKPPLNGPHVQAFTANLRRLRVERQLTYAEMSKRLAGAGRSLSPVAIRRTEDGERRADLDDVAAFAEALNVSFEALLNAGELERHRTACLRWLLAEAEWNQGIRPIKPPFGGISIGTLAGVGGGQR